MLNPDGTFMAFISLKKANWYVKYKLADWDGEHTSVRLIFEPNGPGATSLPEQFPRVNHCVVCGTKEKLSLHHVIPYCFRHYFPAYLKSHASHDVVPTCTHCHRAYEPLATQLKHQIMGEHGLALQDADYLRKVRQYMKITSARRVLAEHGDKIPEERKALLQKRADLPLPEGISGDKRERRKSSDKAAHKLVKELLAVGEGALLEFERKWRAHFLTTMEPKFMPKAWDLNWRGSRENSNS